MTEEKFEIKNSAGLTICGRINIPESGSRAPKARERKEFSLADELRRKIEAEGYRVEDTEEGQQLRTEK